MGELNVCPSLCHWLAVMCVLLVTTCGSCWKLSATVIITASSIATSSLSLSSSLRPLTHRRSSWQALMWQFSLVLATASTQVHCQQCLCNVGRPKASAPCGLRGCKNGPAPFLGRMSYKVTKPGLVSVLYLSICYTVLLFIRAPFYVWLVFIVCVLSFGCSS